MFAINLLSPCLYPISSSFSIYVYFKIETFFIHQFSLGLKHSKVYITYIVYLRVKVFFYWTHFGQCLFTSFILDGYIYPLQISRYKFINTLKNFKCVLIFFTYALRTAIMNYLRDRVVCTTLTQPITFIVLLRAYQLVYLLCLILLRLKLIRQFRHSQPNTQ